MMRKLTLAALSATMIASSFAGVAMAKEHKDRPVPPMARPAIFVFMLKNFDTNKDGKITAEEAKVGADTLFAAVDANKDGTVTPKEIRAYRKAKMEAMKEAMKAKAGEKAGADAMGAPDGAEGPDGAAPPKHGWHKGHHGKGHHGRGMMGPGMMRFLDADENGQVSKEEAENAAAKLLKQMDTNGDGVVSIDDFPG